MVTIRRIMIRNFVVFRECALRPSTDSKRPLTIIRGENASGKTTLLRAIAWCLWGREALPGPSPARFEIQPVDWTPQHGPVSTQVKIEFETDGATRYDPTPNTDTVRYLLRRTVTTVPDSAADRGHSRTREEVTLLRQDPFKGWMEDRSWPADVVRVLLPLSLKDFIVVDADQASDFVGGTENKFIKPGEVIKKTTGAVTALLGLEAFSKAAKVAAARSNEFRGEATKLSGSHDLAAWQGEFDQVDEEIGTLERRLVDDRDVARSTAVELDTARLKLESRVGSLHREEGRLKERLGQLRRQRKTLRGRRERVLKSFASRFEGGEMLSVLAGKQIRQAASLLERHAKEEPIPPDSIGFVRSLLDRGSCVCSGGLEPGGAARARVETELARSEEPDPVVRHLRRVHAAAVREKDAARAGWSAETDRVRDDLGACMVDLASLKREDEDVEEKLERLSDPEVQSLRNEIEALQGKRRKLDQSIVLVESALERKRPRRERLRKQLVAGQRKHRATRRARKCQRLAECVATVLKRSYRRMLNGQVADLNRTMHAYFVAMADNVARESGSRPEDSEQEIAMIATVGVRATRKNTEQFEIVATGRHGQEMSPTQINGASRRLLALSFILALCEVSRTRAPFIADSLLNFMSGAVRTSALRTVAESHQPILLLTGSDLAARVDMELAKRLSGATYTLTPQLQYGGRSGNVVNRTEEGGVSVVCKCAPWRVCNVCERHGGSSGPTGSGNLSPGALS